MWTFYQDGAVKTKDQQASRRITPRSENFSQWYLDVIAASEVTENSPVKVLLFFPLIVPHPVIKLLLSGVMKLRGSFFRSPPLLSYCCI